MPELVQHAHLNEHEREALADAARKSHVESVIKELRRTLNDDREPLEKAAESATVPPDLAATGREAAQRRKAILQALAPFLGEDTAALLKVTEQAERFLDETCSALNTDAVDPSRGTS